MQEGIQNTHESASINTHKRLAESVNVLACFSIKHSETHDYVQKARYVYAGTGEQMCVFSAYARSLLLHLALATGQFSHISLGVRVSEENK